VSKQTVMNWIKTDSQPFSQWSLISITGDKASALTDPEKLRLKFLGCKDICPLQFADVGEKEFFENSRIFDINDCSKTISFANDRHTRDGQEILVVHCMAGISRSGAVGLFLNDMFGLDYGSFKNENPTIIPNQCILSMLRKSNNYWSIS